MTKKEKLTQDSQFASKRRKTATATEDLPSMENNSNEIQIEPALRLKKSDQVQEGLRVGQDKVGERTEVKDTLGDCLREMEADGQSDDGDVDDFINNEYNLFQRNEEEPPPDREASMHKNRHGKLPVKKPRDKNRHEPSIPEP